MNNKLIINNISQDKTINNMFGQIEKVIEENKNEIIYQINNALVNTYFMIGKIIVENEQNGNIRAEYGKKYC